MDILKFVESRPYLYHLTNRDNLDYILNQKMLYSTTQLIHLSDMNETNDILKKKRLDHFQISIKGRLITIRDQKPLSEKVLKRCLENDCSYEDFLNILNSRVFFWPTEKRLIQHFNTYQNEKPIIIRVNTKEMFDLNLTPLFCRLNSGATRCNSHLGGNAPARGRNTFITAENFPLTPSNVAEVTFEKECYLPTNLFVSDNSLTNFKKISMQ